MHKAGRSRHVGAAGAWRSYGAYWQFVREFVRHPRQIGAVCPSSPVLARHMAGLVPPGRGLVVELGPGGGAVTAALLHRGVAARDLVLVERSEALARQLSRRFPGVCLIRGDAACLSSFDALQRRNVRAIVSSLPLRSLPADDVRSILDQISAISTPGTMFIQFSYALRRSYDGMAQGFAREHAQVVWRNIPPARIEAFRFGGDYPQSLAA